MITPEHYKIAIKEIGVKESVGIDNNSRILEYHATVNLSFNTDEISWCSSFVNWCVCIAGLHGTGRGNARSWLSYGEEVESPRIGDIVIFWRGNKGSWMGHVGFYAGEGDGKILVLGGNQNNSVCFRYYSKERLLGVRRVQYP